MSFDLASILLAADIILTKSLKRDENMSCYENFAFAIILITGRLYSVLGQTPGLSDIPQCAVREKLGFKTWILSCEAKI